MKTAVLKQLAHRKIGILGLGVSGLACLRFLLKHDVTPSLFDSNVDGFGAKQAFELLPQAQIAPIGEGLLQQDLLIVSPGIPLANNSIVAAQKAGIEVISDVELFARLTEQAVIGITGSNGKSTVTELVTKILNDADVPAASCGNIGVSVFEVLEQPEKVAVLELSSYQLESTFSLDCVSATVLNVVEDHMDRYDSFEQYAQTKRCLYAQTQLAVVNLDNAQSYVPAGIDVEQLSFSLHDDEASYFASGAFISTKVNGMLSIVCPINQMALNGQHDIANALAAIALVQPFKVSPRMIMATLAKFSGLPHRCQKLRLTGGSTGEALWINDSKATNVGATVTAIMSVKPQIDGKLLLIAGGDGKAADFTPLKAVMADNIDALITIGQDAELISAQFDGPTRTAESMAEAVQIAHDNAQVGDCVLLSPACASQPMFKDYIERGDHFMAFAKEVIRHKRSAVRHG